MRSERLTLAQFKALERDAVNTALGLDPQRPTLNAVQLAQLRALQGRMPNGSVRTVERIAAS